MGKEDTDLERDIKEIKEMLALICDALNIQKRRANVTDIPRLARKLIEEKERRLTAKVQTREKGKDKLK